MKFTKTLLASAVAAASFASFVPAANAEISGSAGIASSYLWRGFDLGTGVPAVWGDLSYSESGFYAGVWVSSGDQTAGTEYDLYLGYGGSVGDFSYDVSLVNYIYPTGINDDSESFGDFVEAIISLGYGPVTLTYYDNIAGETDFDQTTTTGSTSRVDTVGGYAPSEDYKYLTLGLEIDAYSFLLGQHDEANFDLLHFDASYAFNDNLSFTLSIPLDSDTPSNDQIINGTRFDEKEPTFVVSYSLPIN